MIKNTICTLLLVFGTFLLSAQMSEEGYIKMELTDVASEDPQMAAGLEMMKGSETEYFFNQEQSLIKLNMMGGMMKMDFLVDSETEDMKMFVDAFGNKSLVESTKVERDKANGDQNEAMEESEIEYDESDTKEILGYACYKAKVKFPNADDMVMDMYITKDLKASPKMIQQLQNVEMDGFPLEYVMEMGQMKMTYTATQIENKVDKEAFILSEKGYQKQSMDEFMEKMGAMGGGGFGF